MTKFITCVRGNKKQNVILYQGLFINIVEVYKFIQNVVDLIENL